MRRVRGSAAIGMLGVAAIVGCGSANDATDDTAPQATTIGETHAGEYNLGPVEFTGSYWNSCAPYAPAIEQQVGANLAGLALKFNGSGALCDACILVKSAAGKSLLARVVTTGETHGPNDVDLSAAAYAALDSGEYPRAMTWELVKCDGGGKIEYQFQTEANPDWTSLWVRNGRLPIKSLEVKSASHAEFTELPRGDDGTLTDTSGFGSGPFSLRVTSFDGQVISDTFPAFAAGGVLQSTAQFQ